ncbi:MAG: PIN domain-containing protein [Actinomycetota bacterium]
MALTHLVETSALTRLNQLSIQERLKPLCSNGMAARAGISDLEIGFSARNLREWDGAALALGAFDLIETQAAHVRRARQVQRLLAQTSRPGRKIPDLLIAAAAEQANLVVLHYDADFDLISEVTGQACEWIVPAGSID